AGDAARRRAGHFGECLGRAVPGVAAGDHEASRRAVGCRRGRAPQAGARRRLPSRRGADARRVRMAQSLSKVLVRAARPSRRIPEGREIMATQPPTNPSPTIKRRLNAPPAKVFAAWTDPEKVKLWMGPGEMKAAHVESDPR